MSLGYVRISKAFNKDQICFMVEHLKENGIEIVKTEVKGIAGVQPEDYEHYFYYLFESEMYFRELKVGEIIPFYEVIFHRDKIEGTKDFALVKVSIEVKEVLDNRIRFAK